MKDSYYEILGMKVNLNELSKNELARLLLKVNEKATPKKPTVAVASKEKDYCRWICPVCGRLHNNNYPLSYCCDCGQKIDWRDYEKYLVDSEYDEEDEEDES